MKPESQGERTVYAYSPVDGTFSLYVWRCPACGRTGKAESWCAGHSAPVESGQDSLRVKREPVLVPHPDTTCSVTKYEDEFEDQP